MTPLSGQATRSGRRAKSMPSWVQEKLHGSRPDVCDRLPTPMALSMARITVRRAGAAMVFLGALALPAAASATPSSPVAALAAPSGGGGISGGDGGSSNQPEPISLSGGGSFFPPAIEAPKHAATPSTHGHGKWFR